MARAGSPHDCLPLAAPPERRSRGAPGFTLADALAVGGLIIALLRRADRVHTACLAQLVNVLGLIRTVEGVEAIAQSIAVPFGFASHCGGDVSLQVAICVLPRTRRCGTATSPLPGSRRSTTRAAPS